MNLLAYLIYLAAAYYITVHAGLSFYRNGRVYILNLMHHDEKITDAINKLLLTGYFLLNLGYSALMISNWEQVTTWAQLIGTIGNMLGKIIMTLGIIHFINMLTIYLLSKTHYLSLKN